MESTHDKRLGKVVQMLTQGKNVEALPTGRRIENTACCVGEARLSMWLLSHRSPFQSLRFIREHQAQMDVGLVFCASSSSGWDSKK